MPTLQELPLPLAIIVAAFWIIQQANAANTKQIVALIDAFDRQYNAAIKDYQGLMQTAFEDRQEARQRWVERDRLLNERLERATIELAQNKSETHALRNVMTTHGVGLELIRNQLQPIANTVELIAREMGIGRGTRGSTSKPSTGGAADD